jgi:CBS domain-containing protein
LPLHHKEVPVNVKVQDIMSASVATCSIQDPLDQAAQKMWDLDCGCLPVVAPDGRVLAMITDRDICMAALTTGKPIRELRVGNSMSKEVTTCRPQEELAAAAHRMAKHCVRRLPVVDGTGKIVGMLSLNDLALAAGGGSSKPSSSAAAEALRVLTAVCQHRTESAPLASGKAPTAAAPTATPAATPTATPAAKEAGV